MKEKSNDRLEARKLKGEDLERLVFDAFREAGWIFPVTEEDVIRAEANQASNRIKVPGYLSDARKVFEEMHKRARYLGLFFKKVARG